MSRLEIRRNKRNGFVVVPVHYSQWPEKWTPQLIAQEKASLAGNPGAWEQEHEISFATLRGIRVFPTFEPAIHVRDIEPIRGKTIMRSWDFGFHHPCCTFSQIDDRDRWLIIDEIMGDREILQDFAHRVLRKYQGFKFEDFCDPAGHQRSDKTEKTSVQVLATLGVFPQSRASHIADGLNLIRRRLSIRDDGEPGLLIDRRRCPITIDAFSGGYCYGDGNARVPQKDGYYDHPIDTLRYLAVNKFSVFDEYRYVVHLEDYQPSDSLTGY